MSRIGALTGLRCRSWRLAGSSRLARARKKLTSLSVGVGSSNDCIWTSSSLTTPPVPSLTTAFLTTPPNGRTSNALAVIDDMPPRAVAMASISSMNPIAPPSVRAALRSALKYARIFFAVAP